MLNDYRLEAGSFKGELEVIPGFRLKTGTRH